MKKITKYNNLAKELKKLKLKRNLYNIFVTGGSVVALGVMIILLVLDCITEPNNYSSDICFINLFMQPALQRERSFRKIEKKYYSDLESYLNSQNDSYIKNLSSSSIEIIPKNIKIGEDLSSRNIVPIFVEGNYIIIKTESSPLFIRDYQIDGENEVEIMDEDDYNVLFEELPEYKEEIQKLKVLSRTSNIYDEIN